MVSHTTSGEWKSFEHRMRRRRAERLLLRADIAAEAGFIDDARAALAEAQRILPTLPDIAVIEQRVRAAEASPPEIAIAVAPAPRHPRYASMAAALVILVIGGLWEASHVQRLPARRFTAVVPVAPAVPQSPGSMPPRVAVVEPPTLVATIGTSGRTTTNAAPAAESASAPSVPRAESPADRPTQFTIERPPAFPRGRSAESMAEIPGESVQPVADASVLTPRPPPTLNLGQPVATAPAAVPLTREMNRGAVAGDETLVRRTLGRYAAAYDNLDADAAQAVWPGVNRGALARAFDDLAAQHVALGDCRIDVSGASARAACAGSMTWAPRLGDATPRTEPRSWRFELAKAGDEWQIVTARVQNR